MNISLNPEAPLAQLYRQARALASDETARPEETFALSTASTAVFTTAAAESRGAPPRTPAERKREQVRRAVIAALRHQALMVRRAWMAQGGPTAEGDPRVQALLQQAAALAEAALNLHRGDDSGRGETEYVLRFLRSTSAIAILAPRKSLPGAAAAPAETAAGAATEADPARAAELPRPPAEDAPTQPAVTSAPAAPPATPLEAPYPVAPAVTGAKLKPEDIVVVGLPPEPLAEKEAERPAPQLVRPRVPRSPADAKTLLSPRLKPAFLAGLAGLVVIGFVAGAITTPRLIGTKKRSAESARSTAVAVPGVSPQGSGVPVQVAVPASSVTPPAGGSIPSAPPKGGTPATPRGTVGGTTRPVTRPAPPVVLAPSGPTVALLVRSEPNGAQVYIGGILRGTTPLRVQARPGGVLAVMVRRGARIWRGVVQVGQVDGQVVAVRLQQPPPAVAQAPPTPAATPAPSATLNPRAHYEALLTQGVELYRSGWYGPAMARFKRAVAVIPSSPRGYLWLGRAAIKAGRPSEARRALERVIALAPGTDAAREAQFLLNRMRVAERGA